MRWGFAATVWWGGRKHRAAFALLATVPHGAQGECPAHHTTRTGGQAAGGHLAVTPPLGGELSPGDPPP